MIKINVLLHNKNWKRYIKDPKSYLKSKIKKLNKKNSFFKNKKVNFSLLLTDSIEIKKLNKKFRKKDKTTDVLSFPFYEKDILKKLLKKKINFYLGDVVINLNKINGYKNEDFKKNFDKLWIHGFLHLLGYRHKLDKEFIKMSNLEKKFFKSIN
tara:strand:- start:2629 stop:3090 length:462 start_codon:yes stop_codon:yes gene_type:complete